MVERLIRSAGNFVLVVAFTFLLPFFCAAAWLGGSADERRLMKLAFCVLSPFTAVFYYIITWHLLFGRRSSYFVQVVVLCFTACGVWWVISTGRLTF